MKELSIYVWWSQGDGDGDGYDETVEVTDEEYEIFKEYQDEEIDEIEDPRIKDTCQRIYKEYTESLEDNSSGEWNDVKDEYAIEPDDEDFWDCEDQDEESDMIYRFDISVEQGDSFVDYKLTPKEKELVYKAIDNEEEFSDSEELHELYERVYEAAKEKLEEDIDLTGDDIDVDELDYEVSFGDYPEYKTRYTQNYDEYFNDYYACGVRVNYFEDEEED